MSTIHRSDDRVVLIEAARAGDAAFYSRWLLRAAEAEALWMEAFADSAFRDSVRSLWAVIVPDFGAAAVEFISLLDEQLSTAVLELDSRKGHEFTMLLGMGFFRLTGHRYQMWVPEQLTLSGVKAALVAFAETEEEYCLRPENLVTTMHAVEAHRWRRLLGAMDEDCREADRRVLLE